MNKLLCCRWDPPSLLLLGSLSVLAQAWKVMFSYDLWGVSVANIIRVYCWHKPEWGSWVGDEEKASVNSHRKNRQPKEKRLLQGRQWPSCLTASRKLLEGDVLVSAGSDPRIIVQFDGSAHRTSQIGCRGCPLAIWWYCCLSADNIVAGHGAELAMHLYEKYVSMCHEQDLAPLPLSRIHGDIKELLHHLDFQSRFRRSDLTGLINNFHRRRSRVAPNAITVYRPRETNVISDYLAG